MNEKTILLLQGDRPEYSTLKEKVKKIAGVGEIHQAVSLSDLIKTVEVIKVDWILIDTSFQNFDLSEFTKNISDAQFFGPFVIFRGNPLDIIDELPKYSLAA